jgi:hypothetical protein
MTILSNVCMFPLFQLSLLLIFLLSILMDRTTRKSPFNGSQIIRGDNSMAMLNMASGFFISVIVALINNMVFSEYDYGARKYSVIINFVDLIAIIYVCYISAWGRNRIIALTGSLRKESIS